MSDSKKTILMALNDSISSRSVVDYIKELSLCPDDWHITLMHFFRQLSASEELMGKKFTKEQPVKMMEVLQKAKDKLVEKGFPPDNIVLKLVDDPYPTIADGIIDQFKRHKYDMLVIGRKRMSKAEEFVMGDISVKLIRALEDVAILVVKSK